MNYVQFSFSCRVSLFYFLLYLYIHIFGVALHICYCFQNNFTEGKMSVYSFENNGLYYWVIFFINILFEMFVLWKRLGKGACMLILHFQFNYVCSILAKMVYSYSVNGNILFEFLHLRNFKTNWRKLGNKMGMNVDSSFSIQLSWL